MPNILLTNFCNRNCPYCFAKARVETGTTRVDWEIGWGELNQILEYVDPRTMPVGLIGGEPSLHFQFADIVREILRRGYEVKLFTNGTTPSLREIRTSRRDAIHLLANLNSPDSYLPEEWNQIEANCRYFGEQIGLSLNIYSADFTWDYLRRAVLDWGLQRRLRVGIAQPIVGAGNCYLSEENMKPAMARLVTMAHDLGRDGISLGLDCGFRACAFTPDQLAELVIHGTEFLFQCSPILDIGPDLMVWRCFPFSSQAGVPLRGFPSLSAVSDHFEARYSRWSAVGNTEGCPRCGNLKTGSCRGGCLARTVIEAAEKTDP